MANLSGSPFYHAIEVRKAKNGFIVSYGSEVYVFRTLKQVNAFINENFASEK